MNTRETSTVQHTDINAKNHLAETQLHALALILKKLKNLCSFEKSKTAH